MSKELILKERYYSQHVDDLISKFNSNPKEGLKSSQLEELYLKHGYNELPKIKKSLWKVYIAPLINFCERYWAENNHPKSICISATSQKGNTGFVTDKMGIQNTYYWMDRQ